MVEFNEDGSIKLPEYIAEKRENEDQIFKNEPSIKITRTQTSPVTPLTCELCIQASDKLEHFDKIESIYDQATSIFEHMAELSIKKINNKEYIIKIISGQYRCSWCKSFRRFIEREMSVKVINKGDCLSFCSTIKR